MFRGFNIKGVDYIDKGLYYEAGKKLFDKQKLIVVSGLKKFVNGDNSLDGSKIQSEWFPEIKCHVFISHSHQDESMAIYLVGWLWLNFKIISFIDSLIWGHSDKLLKEIDGEYCMNDDEITYNYNKRNFSTSHVHMMLSTALARMIDQTECLFFLETPNSIKPSDEIKNKTKSAWIYLEITLTQIVEKRRPLRNLTLLHERTKFATEELNNKALEIEHTLDLSHLANISSESLKEWRKFKHLYYDPESALDGFYELHPPKKVRNTLHG